MSRVLQVSGQLCWQRGDKVERFLLAPVRIVGLRDSEIRADTVLAEVRAAARSAIDVCAPDRLIDELVLVLTELEYLEKLHWRAPPELLARANAILAAWPAPMRTNHGQAD